MKWPSHSMSTHPLWSKANQIFQCPNDVTSVNKNFLSYYYAPGTVQGTQRNRDEKNHDFMTCTSIHRKVKVMLRYKLVHEAVGDKKGDDKFYLWELRKSSQRRWNLGWVLKMSKYKPGGIPVGALKKAHTLPTCIKLESLQNTFSYIAWLNPPIIL